MVKNCVKKVVRIQLFPIFKYWKTYIVSSTYFEKKFSIEIISREEIYIITKNKLDTKKKYYVKTQKTILSIKAAKHQKKMTCG